MGIARTFQVVRPFANLTVLENVARRRDVRRRRRAALGRRGASAWPTRCSSSSTSPLDANDPAESLPIAGRKRLELAKALAMEPRLLLLDEVMAGLRGVEVDQAMDLIRAVNARGITLLIIEHVMKVISGVCSGSSCSTTARRSPTARPTRSPPTRP